MKDLTWQMRNRETKKFTEKFVRLYKIKKIISENMVKLQLLVSMKIYLVVNISRITMYQEQIEGQKKISSPLVKINRENIKQKRHKKKTEVFSQVEEIYNKRRHMGWVRDLWNAIDLVVMN